MENEKKLIFFDLDGTLAESKQAPDHEMAELLCKLLLHKFVAIISGGSFAQFQKQLLSHVVCSEKQYEKLFLMPTSGSTLYHFVGDRWQQMYEEKFSDQEAAQLREALEEVMRIFGYSDETEHGPTVENRGSQFTFSALGQYAPVEVKKDWDPHQEKRRAMVEKLIPLLPNYTITMGGMSSIDITKKGIDKAFGIRKLSEHTLIPIEEMVYVGDALYPGGNDEVAKNTGIECVEVQNPEDTKKLIRTIIGQ